MKNKIFMVIALLLSLALFSAVPSAVYADPPEMKNYCQAPPFITAVVPPNLVLGIDESGSMGYKAYQISGEGQHKTCSNNPAMRCDEHGDADCARKYCQNQPSHHCEDNHDCDEHGGGSCVAPPAGGVCQTASSSTPYGYCNNSITTSCRLNSECKALPSCAVPANCQCIPRMVYEGYFEPSKYYELGADGIYYEDVPTGLPCTTKYTYTCSKNNSGSCTTTKPADALNTCSGSTKWYCNKGNPTSTSGDCGTEPSGNLLNYDNMTRIDLLRWAMTGGTPKSCSATSATKDDCDPRMWNAPGNAGKVGSACNDTQKLNVTNTKQGGCVLMGHDTSIKVATPWVRVYDGLLHQFQNLAVQPKIGAMFFSGTKVQKYVYVGDFTGPNSLIGMTYQNLLTEINKPLIGGYTPTGPAMWDILNYYAQKPPKYGGIPEEQGGGDVWKNPMWECKGQGGPQNCSYVPCSKNFVLLMSDGLWNQGGGPNAANSCSIKDGFSGTPPSVGQYSAYNLPFLTYSADPVVPSYLMHKGFKNKTPSSDFDTKITAVYTVGLFVSTEGQKSLENVALYGSFENNEKSWPSNRKDYPGIQAGDPTNCAITTTGAACPGNQGTGSNCNAVPVSSSDWDKNGDGVADTFYYAEDAQTIKQKLMEAVLDMLSRVASGTAASVLASGEGSGANLVQAVFYPRHSYGPGQSEISWTSTLQNLWYYIDPKTTNSTIRENTADTGSVPELNLNKDYIANILFDTSDQTTKAFLYADVNGDGLKDNPAVPTKIVKAEDLKYLWEAGIKLWGKDPSTRRIFTNVNGAPAMLEFSTANLASTAPTLKSLLNSDYATRTPGGNSTIAQNIVRYVRGEDIPSTVVDGETINYRGRSTAIDLNRDGDILDVVGGVSEASKVWKLGDIISSTPRLVSWVPLHQYDTAYGDTTYYDFTKTSTYKNRGMVFVGANDGMLHAFKLGTLKVKNDEFIKAQITGTDLGTEEWAFIPKNMLPYLQYMTDTDYCHLYYIDATPVIIDASIGEDGCTHNTAQDSMDTNEYWNCKRSKDTWRTVLIGGLRQGGACKDPATYVGANGVKAPATGSGYSSYFALDVTDQSNPKFMWEFAPTDGSLGFATTGPAVMRIAARSAKSFATTSTANKGKNGRWFAVFASGPTGPIDTTIGQFQGHSDQNLKLFILDLKTGSLLRTIDTGIKNAFGGSLNTGVVDYDIDYQDDALYYGYTMAETDPPAAATKWSNGGIMRLVTREDLNGITYSTTALDPNNWTSSSVIGNIGSITASIGHLAHYPSGTTRPDQGYLYAGTGRYYFNSRNGIDDGASQRYLYGLQEPCLEKILANEICTDTVSSISSADAGGLSSSGNWRISLDAVSGNSFSERVISDPVASSLGAVFFTSFQPNADVCTFGGKTYLWAMRYDTGGSVASYLKGITLMQVSTGAIEEIHLDTAFGNETDPNSKFGRRTPPINGMPPGMGTPPVVPPKASKKVIHLKKY